MKFYLNRLFLFAEDEDQIKTVFSNENEVWRLKVSTHCVVEKIIKTHCNTLT